MRARRQRGLADLRRLCDAGLGVEDFRAASLRCLRSAVTIEAAFYATVDAATMLMTSAWADEPLAGSAQSFLDNEYGADDVNRFAHLADRSDPVGSLDLATGRDRASSPRYRDLMAPMGLGDEARAALRSRGQCWGVLCLHRADGEHGFDLEELEFLRAAAPILGEGLRRGLAISSLTGDGAVVPGPGVVILDPELRVRSMNGQARRWLADLGAPAASDELPIAVLSTAAAASEARDGDLPSARTRVRLPEGGFMTVHASALSGTPDIAVVLDAALPDEVTSLVLAAHGLTPAQQRTAALVLRGRSTQQIANELQISAYTVQEHLGAVFAKFGIGSRRELVAALGARRG